MRASDFFRSDDFEVPGVAERTSTRSYVESVVREPFVEQFRLQSSNATRGT